MHLHLLPILVAFLLLFFGQRLYWLFVGGVGFIAGMDVIARHLVGQPEWVILLAAVLAGVVGAILAIFFQRVAVGIAGFLAGGYFSHLAVESIVGAANQQVFFVAFIVVGILFALLAVIFLDWALIGISALLGATLISQWAFPGPPLRQVLFAVLFVVGVLAQAGMLRSRRRTLIARPPA